MMTHRREWFTDQEIATAIACPKLTPVETPNNARVMVERNKP